MDVGKQSRGFDVCKNLSLTTVQVRMKRQERFMQTWQTFLSHYSCETAFCSLFRRIVLCVLLWAWYIIEWQL